MHSNQKFIITTWNLHLIWWFRIRFYFSMSAFDDYFIMCGWFLFNYFKKNFAQNRTRTHFNIFIQIIFHSKLFHWLFNKKQFNCERINQISRLKSIHRVSPSLSLSFHFTIHRSIFILMNSLYFPYKSIFSREIINDWFAFSLICRKLCRRHPSIVCRHQNIAPSSLHTKFSIDLPRKHEDNTQLWFVTLNHVRCKKKKKIVRFIIQLEAENIKFLNAKRLFILIEQYSHCRA